MFCFNPHCTGPAFPNQACNGFPTMPQMRRKKNITPQNVFSRTMAPKYLNARFPTFHLSNGPEKRGVAICIAKNSLFIPDTVIKDSLLLIQPKYWWHCDLDHSPVKILLSDLWVKQKPAAWCFNTSLLNDPIIHTEIETTICQIIEKREIDTFPKH